TVIVACADPRVSSEILFDAGIGDLFVIRVAGNYVGGAGSSVKGSIEYAVLESEAQPGDLLENSTRANVRRSVQRLKALDPIIGPKVKAGTVEVVGGIYHLGTGKVTLL